MSHIVTTFTFLSFFRIFVHSSLPWVQSPNWLAYLSFDNESFYHILGMCDVCSIVFICLFIHFISNEIQFVWVFFFSVLIQIDRFSTNCIAATARVCSKIHIHISSNWLLSFGILNKVQFVSRFFSFFSFTVNVDTAFVASVIT